MSCHTVKLLPANYRYAGVSCTIIFSEYMCPVLVSGPDNYLNRSQGDGKSSYLPPIDPIKIFTPSNS